MTQKPHLSVSQLDRFIASLRDRGVVVDPDQAAIILEEAVTIAHECFPRNPASALVPEIVSHLRSQDAPDLWRHNATRTLEFIGRLIEAEERVTGYIRSEQELLEMLSHDALRRDRVTKPEPEDRWRPFARTTGALGDLVERALSGEFGDAAREDVTLYMVGTPGSRDIESAFLVSFAFWVHEARIFAERRMASRGAS